MKNKVSRYEGPFRSRTFQAKEEDCIYTLETGKHESYLLHSVHQSNAPFWFQRCPACGWIDLKQMINEMTFLTKLKYAFFGVK